MWSTHRKSFNIALWILLFFAFSTKHEGEFQRFVVCASMSEWMNDVHTFPKYIRHPSVNCVRALSLPSWKFPTDACFIRVKRGKKTDSFGKFSLYCYCLCIKHRLPACRWCNVVNSFEQSSPASDRVVVQWGMLKHIEIFLSLSLIKL